MFKQELIEAIDDIDHLIIESEIDTCDALLHEYDKLDSLINNDENNFFSESYIMESGDEKKEPFLKRLLLFVVRTFKSIISNIIYVFTGKKKSSDSEKESEKHEKEYAKQIAASNKKIKRLEMVSKACEVISTGLFAGLAIVSAKNLIEITHGKWNNKRAGYVYKDHKTKVFVDETGEIHVNTSLHFDEIDLQKYLDDLKRWVSTITVDEIEAAIKYFRVGIKSSSKMSTWNEYPYKEPKIENAKVLKKFNEIRISFMKSVTPKEDMYKTNYADMRKKTDMFRDTKRLSIMMDSMTVALTNRIDSISDEIEKKKTSITKDDLNKFVNYIITSIRDDIYFVADNISKVFNETEKVVLEIYKQTDGYDKVAQARLHMMKRETDKKNSKKI